METGLRRALVLSGGGPYPAVATTRVMPRRGGVVGANSELLASRICFLCMFDFFILCT